MLTTPNTQTGAANYHSYRRFWDDKDLNCGQHVDVWVTYDNGASTASFTIEGPDDRWFGIGLPNIAWSDISSNKMQGNAFLWFDDVVKEVTIDASSVS